MPNLNPNSTNYTHSYEPNTNDLSLAMAYDPYGNPVIRIDDTTKQHTSKNRVKVSTFEVTDFGTFINGKDGDIWDELTVGTASAAIEPFLGMVKLEVGSTVGDSVIRQTKRVQRYIPGRENEVSMALIFGTPTIGVRRRFGLFDDFNGIYIEDSGDGTYHVVLRRNTESGPVETRVARENWNRDRLDGTGPSGIVIDPVTIQMMSIEYEWYGAGQVEFKFVIDDNAHPVHVFRTGNVLTTTWAANAALPVRVELTNFAGAAGTHTLFQGSHAFTTEGVTELLGRQKSIASAITGRDLGTANTFTPVVAIRLKSNALNTAVIPDEFSGATLDNTSIFVRAIENAVIEGGEWVSFSDNSSIEYNITATGFTGGNALATVFISSGNMGTLFALPERSITQIQRRTEVTLGDTTGTFLVAVASTQSNKSGWASLGWIEVR